MVDSSFSEEWVMMQTSGVRDRKGERATLNSCAHSHWLPPSTNDSNPTLLACLDANFSVIHAATRSSLIWLLPVFSPGLGGSGRTCRWLIKYKGADNQAMAIADISCSRATLLVGVRDSKSTKPIKASVSLVQDGNEKQTTTF